MTEGRPDPDALLAQARAEARPRGGRLKVFLGMCAGVGKTFTMLESAREQRAAGREVVVGLVETHGRRETNALIEGLEVMPRREIVHRGIRLAEFDLDGALARRPALLILDELPHTNAPGSRHAKRWMDVEELCAAGVDVYTAINIQHVESLNDAVAQITGVRVRETVPDAVLERADEVVLVDLPPDELMQRLRDGKVYLGTQAARAAEHFFRPDRLAALRELALRFVAERMAVRVRVARLQAGAAAVWPTGEHLLVAVGPSPSSERLIRSTKRLAGMLQAPWTALSVETPATASLPIGSRERIASHLRMAGRLGAEVGTATGDNVSEVLLREARRRNVTKIVVGKPVLPRWREWLRGSPVDDLVRASGDMDVYVIRGEGEAPVPAADAGRKLRTPPAAGWLRDYAQAIGAVAVATAAAFAMNRAGSWFGIADIAMVYVIGVAVGSLASSRRASFVASVLAVLALDFFFVPPHFTLLVDSPRYLVTFAVLLLVSFGVSSLSLRLREQRDLARRVEQRTAALLRFTAQLTGVRLPADTAGVAVRAAADILASRALIFLPGESGRVALAAASPPAQGAGDKEISVAQWVYDNRQPAGAGTQTLVSAGLMHIPLVTGDTCGGVLALELPGEQGILLPEQQQLVDAFARQVALALGLARLEENQHEATLEAENERLRSSLLSALSHDLRTPLASIMGSAGSLAESGENLPADVRRDLLESIQQEADLLNRLFGNVVELTRIEAGGVRLRCEPVPVVDIVSAATRPLRKRLARHKLELRIPADLPFVLADELLLNHVLLNLLDNATKYTPAGSPLGIEARSAGSDVVIEVADRGPGLAPSEAAYLFDKFYRGTASAGTRGAGLGLSICRAIVEAHGGRIWAENAPGGGAVFRFTLPAAHVEMPEDEPSDPETAEEHP